MALGLMGYHWTSTWYLAAAMPSKFAKCLNVAIGRLQRLTAISIFVCFSMSAHYALK